MSTVLHVKCGSSMPIVDMYSSRHAAAQQRGDVWVYDQIPPVLRVQVSNIIEGALGPVRDYGYSAGPLYRLIHDTVAHEHGRPRLASGEFDDRPRAQVHACLRSEPDVLVWLDVVEVALRGIGNVLGRLDDDTRRVDGIRISPEDAVDELNERFRRAGFGYRYEGGQIFRIDTEFMHREATIPALRVLSDPRFLGADQEFRAAHEHLKAGEYRDCAVDANNALESTMKAICDAKGWTYEKGARVSDLVKLLRREGLFPDFVVLSLEQLLATLKSGLPVVRNEIGGHGQGSAPVEVPEYMAVYALNLAASKIRLLYEAFAASEK